MIDLELIEIAGEREWRPDQIGLCGGSDVFHFHVKAFFHESQSGAVVCFHPSGSYKISAVFEPYTCYLLAVFW